MTTDEPIRLEQLDAALAGVAPKLSDVEQHLAVTVYRMLATAQPVTVLALAAEIGAEADEVERTLRSWPGVFRDDEGALVGFWGLALAEMPHRLRVGGLNLFAWCAWDPLFLARIIGPMDVATEDPITGDTIAYHLDGTGMVRDLTHSQATLSFLRPETAWDDDVMSTFCHYVRLFTSLETARQWTEEHAGTFTLSLADGVELARRHVSRAFYSLAPLRRSR